MIANDLITSLIIAFVITLVFGIILRKRQLGFSIAFFFILLFFMTWAAGIWLPALKPLLLGTPVLTFLASGLVLGLLIFALLPQRPFTKDINVESRLLPVKRVRIGSYIYLVALIVISVFAIVLKYIQRSLHE